MSLRLHQWLLATLLVATGSSAVATPTEIACGETQVGILGGNPQELVIFARKGEVVAATIVADPPLPGFEPRWRILDLEGQPVLLSNGNHRCYDSCATAPLPDGGSFTLRISDSGLGLGRYVISFEALSATANGESNGPPTPACARVRNGAPDGTRPIGSDALAGVIDIPGETDTFTMTVTAGELVTVDLTPGDDAGHLDWSVFDANGTAVARTDDGKTAPVATGGVVTILVAGEGRATGAYEIRAGHEMPPTTTTTSTTSTTHDEPTTTSTEPSTTSTTAGDPTTTSTLETTTTTEPVPTTTTVVETTTTTELVTTTTLVPPTTTTTLAPVFDLEDVISEPPLGTRAHIGSALAVVGGRVLIGAPHEDVRANEMIVRDAGAVIAVEVGGDPDAPAFGAFGRFVEPGAPASGHEFGAAIAAAGDGMIVGAPGTPAAYVFPSLLDHAAVTIEPPVAGAGGFGSAVAATGDFVAVGAPGADGGVGTAFVFERAAGTPHVVLKVPGLPVGSRFGAALAAANGLVLVGAPGGPGVSGAAFLFDSDTGELIHAFALETPEPGDEFGLAVTFAGDDPVVGAPGASGGRGRAERFDAVTGERTVVYDRPDDAIGTGFGAALVVAAGEVVVGAPAELASGVPSGAFHEFAADTGLLLRTTRKSSPAAGDDFAAALGAVGTRLIVASPGDDAGTTDGGTVYVYEMGVVVAALRERLSNDQFGSVTVADGDQLLVGAPAGADGDGFVTRIDGEGNAVETIPAHEPGPTGFGSAIAVAGSSVVVGASESHDRAGRVDLFDGTTFVRELESPEGQPGDRFGFAVAKIGDDVVASAPFAGDTDTGRVFRIDPTTGNVRITYGKAVPTGGDFFGAAIAADDGQLLVGAPNDASGGAPTGAAYLFDAETAAITHAIVNPNGTNDLFGASVALGQWIVVGAPFAANMVGEVFVFDRATGTLVRHIENPRGGPNDDFGRAVALLGEQVLVGAPLTDDHQADSGMAYLFDGGTGALIQTFRNPPQGAFDHFGYSVAASATGLLIGSPGPSRVYLFDPIVQAATFALRAAPFASTPPAQCGNGLVEGTEACDDGNTNDLDDCRNDCTQGLCCAVDALVGRCDDHDPCTDDRLGPNGCMYTAKTTGDCCADDGQCGSGQECRLCLGCFIYGWDCCEQGSHCVDAPGDPLCADKTCVDAAYCECEGKLDCGDGEALPDALRAPFALACDALRLQTLETATTPVTKSELVLARQRTHSARKSLKKTMRMARRLEHQKVISRSCRQQVIEQARVVRKAIPRRKALRNCLANEG
jgi:hypothetical protein